MRVSPFTRVLVVGATVSTSIFAIFTYGIQRSSESSKYVVKTCAGYPNIPCWAHVTGNATSNVADWQFVTERDADNHGLSEEQCLVAFPKLFKEIDKTATLRAERLVTYKEVNSRKNDQGVVRGLVDHGEVGIG